MKRFHKLLASLVIFIGVWFSLMQDLPIKLEGPLREILPVLPLYMLVAFGAYSAIVISYNIMTFPECYEEAKSLERERALAIEELKKKGIDVFGKK